MTRPTFGAADALNSSLVARERMEQTLALKTTLEVMNDASEWIEIGELPNPEGYLVGPGKKYRIVRIDNEDSVVVAYVFSMPVVASVVASVSQQPS